MTRTAESAAPSYFRIGVWLVRPSECALIRGDGSVHVEPRAMDVLRTLAEANGNIVSTEELLLRCWRGTFYGDSPVHKTIAQLRAALGDSALSPEFIATVRKRGYRLIPPVQFPEGYAPRAAGPRASWPHGSPFRGLQPFTLEHASIYFGRTRAIAEVLNALRRQAESGVRFVLCVGASGVGKSSLLQAGVAAALLNAGNSDGWKALACGSSSMVGADPFEALARALLTLRPFDEALFLESEISWLTVALRDEPAQVVEHTCARLARHRDFAPATHGVVLIIDELEGVLREHVDATEFAATLRVLASSPQFSLLAACRSDAYGRLSDVPELIALKGSDGHVDIAAPSIAELSEMLREPAHSAGLRFERDAASGARLDDVLRDAAFRHPECLPILSHALAQLYEQRGADNLLRFESYRAIGGLVGALAGQAERTFASIPSEAQSALPRLLGRMVVFLDSETVACSQPVRERGLGDDERRLCDAFVDARLFVRAAADGEPVIRPAHDALLRHWGRASGWIEHNRSLLASLTRLRIAALHWQGHGQSRDLLLARGLPLEEGRAVIEHGQIDIDPAVREFILDSLAQARRGVRLQRLLFAVLVLLTLGATASGWLAARSARVAAEQRAEAERLVAFMVDDLNRSLQPLGRLDVLDGIVDAVSGYLNRNAHADASEQSVRFRAEALLQLAEIRVRQGQDRAALELAENAHLRLQPLLLKAAVAPSVLKSAGNAAYWVGYLHYRARRTDAVTQAWRAYDRYTERWLSAAPDDQLALMERSYAINNLAVLDRDRGDFRSAAAKFGASIALKQRALAARPNDRTVIADLADSQSWLASALSAIGEVSAAKTSLMQALALVRGVRAVAPSEAMWTHREASLQMNLALLELDAGDLAAADRQLQAARERLTSLQQLDASNRDWQRDLLFVRQQLAWQRVLAGELDAGRRELEACAVAIDALRADNPDNAEWRTLAAAVDERRAHAMVSQGDAHATDLASHAVKLMEPDPGEVTTAGDLQVLIRARITLGDALQANGQADAARQSWERADQELRTRHETQEQVALLELELALHRRLGRADQAERVQRTLHTLGIRRQAFDRFSTASKESNHGQ